MENNAIFKNFFSINTRRLFGFYIFLFGFLILLKIIFPKEFKFYYFILIIIIIISLDFIFRSIFKRRYKKLIIPGVTLFLTSLFLLCYLFILKSIHFFNIIYIWPVFGIFPSISLILYYLIDKDKNPASIIPGIFLLIISLILFLFTYKIINNFKFRYLLLFSIPFLIMISGLYLIFGKDKNSVKSKEQ